MFWTWCYIPDEVVLYDLTCRYKTALVEFEDALVAAEECKDTTIQTLCKVEIGICKGSLALKDLAENVETQSIFVNGEEEWWVWGFCGIHGNNKVLIPILVELIWVLLVTGSKYKIIVISWIRTISTTGPIFKQEATFDEWGNPTVLAWWNIFRKSRNGVQLQNQGRSTNQRMLC